MSAPTEPAPAGKARPVDRGVVKPERPGAADPGWTRIPLWSAALRWQHWLSVLLIVILSATGWYIMDPFFGAQPEAPGETGFLMGWIRFIHFTAAFAWILVGLARFILLFVAKGQQSRWRALWPFYSKKDVTYMFQTIAAYMFLRKHGPTYVTHNALQQISYTGIYVIAVFQVLTGLSLYGLYDQSNWFWVLWSYPVHWLGVPMVRLIHTVIMFILWAFVIIHVYLVVRSEAVEGHGSLSAMVGGSMWLPDDEEPVDLDRVGPGRDRP